MIRVAAGWEIAGELRVSRADARLSGTLDRLCLEHSCDALSSLLDLLGQVDSRKNIMGLGGGVLTDLHCLAHQGKVAEACQKRPPQCCFFLEPAHWWVD